MNIEPITRNDKPTLYREFKEHNITLIIYLVVPNSLRGAMVLI